MGDEKKPKPLSLGEAVSKGIIANETLAYFIGRTWLFFKRIGINPERMRFRQHLLHEVCGAGVGGRPGGSGLAVEFIGSMGLSRSGWFAITYITIMAGL